jgi:hypothetical protein
LGSKAVHKTDTPVLFLQERVVTFVLRQEEGSETISKAALLQFLQHEYEVSCVSIASVCAGSGWYSFEANPAVVMLFLACLFVLVVAQYIVWCLQNADSSDAATPQPQMQFMPFQQAGEFGWTSTAGRCLPLAAVRTQNVAAIL